MHIPKDINELNLDNVNSKEDIAGYSVDEVFILLLNRVKELEKKESTVNLQDR